VTQSTVRSPRPLSAAETESQIEARTASVDQLVVQAYSRQFAHQEGVAAMAVGGFGRRELFPHSDVDVLLLVAPALPPAELKNAVGSFMQELWDAGLRLSHSVRTVDECCQLHEGNTELSISLIDRRLLSGDAALFAQLEARLPKFFRLQGRTIARHLAQLTRARHSKFQNTIYHLEPNLKETPGGMRDLHVVHWVSKLLESEAPPLDASRAFLFPLRYFLHERSRRDDNVLSFEAQDEVSGQPAEMMRSYFRHARAIARAAADAVQAAEDTQPSLIGQFRDWRTRLSNAEFTVSRDAVFLRSPQQLTRDHSLLGRLFEFVGRHGLPLSRDSERRVAAAVAELRDARATWTELKPILSLPKASAALRAMEQTGVLAALLPEWRRIECLVVRDFYHRYTVDEHTLVAVELLEHIEDGRFRDLHSEIDRPALLRLALLLHDIGKGHGNHVAEGLRLTREILDRLGVAAGDSETVLFLIEHHLALSAVMSSRDLDDVATARALAEDVGTVERLKLLTLLTYADISAVNPTAMTPWRRDQLWRTYRLAHDELTRELDTERIHAPGSASPALSEFLDGFPTRYVRTHSQEEIRRHFELWEEAHGSGIGIAVERNNGYYRLVVATADRPFLFASISGALAAFGMNILKAEAFANSAHFVLDTFTFADPMRTLELNPSETDRMRDTIARVVVGKDDVRRLLRNRPRPSPRIQAVAPRVAFNNDASPAATLIEIVADDRPGLLYDLASAMSEGGCNIEVVLIDTEAHKALDVFYVTAQGRKLHADRHQALREALLAACNA
jgi:[protein-PII] uridylyltransferase